MDEEVCVYVWRGGGGVGGVVGRGCAYILPLDRVFSLQFRHDGAFLFDILILSSAILSLNPLP